MSPESLRSLVQYLCTDTDFFILYVLSDSLSLSIFSLFPECAMRCDVMEMLCSLMNGIASIRDLIAIPGCGVADISIQINDK